MKNVYSLAFFRSDQSGYESERAGASQGRFFLNMLPMVVHAHSVTFPDFELRIHHDDRVMEFEYFHAMEEMNAEGLLRLVPMGPAKRLCSSMLWRLCPIWDEDVEYVVCRDVDSLPMHRDRKMIQDFMDSGATAHLILDSESHGGLMGGMTAFHAPKLRAKFPHIQNLDELLLIDGTIDMNQHGADQIFLNRHIWPRVYKETLVHQRRQDVMYPNALKTLPVAPQVTELDKVITHVGAAFPIDKAMEALDGLE